MDLNRLVTFAEVADALSFAEAARRTGVQRSSVSRSVAALEAELGVALLSRTTRVVTLTPEGAALLAQIRPQLASLREALRTVPTGAEELTGTLKLTCSVDFGTTVLPPVIASFMRRYPSQRVDLAIHNRVVDLVKEGFDAALRPQPERRADSSLVSRKILSLEGQLFASPGYLAARGTPRSAADLVGHDMISFRGRVLPPPAPKLPPPKLAVDELLFVREAVRQGMGIGMLASQLVADDVLAGRLVRVLPRQLAFRGGLYLVHAPTRHLPRRLIAFRDHFLEHVARAA